MSEPKSGLETVFENLTRWRGQPGYQLERRLDALMSPYLARFLESRSEDGSKFELVTSELPIPLEFIRGKSERKAAKKDGHHFSADFLLLRHGPNPAWILLELKTDMGSRKPKEDANYRAVVKKDTTMKALLKALRKAKKASDFRSDYGRQAWGVGAHRYPDAPIEVHYLQPVRSPDDEAEAHDRIRTHTLSQFIRHHDDEGDPLWTMLQELLRGVVRSNKARRAK